MSLLSRLFQRSSTPDPLNLPPIYGVNLLQVEHVDLELLDTLHCKHVRILHKLYEENTLEKKIRMLKVAGIRPLVCVTDIPLDWSTTETVGCLRELISKYPDCDWQLLDVLAEQLPSAYADWYISIASILRSKLKNLTLIPASLLLEEYSMIREELTPHSSAIALVLYGHSEDESLESLFKLLRHAHSNHKIPVWITDYGMVDRMITGQELATALRLLPRNWRAYYRSLREQQLYTNGSARGLVSYENQTIMPAFAELQEILWPKASRKYVNIKMV